MAQKISLFLLLLSSIFAFKSDHVIFTKIYHTKGNCSYDIYVAEFSGKIRCESFEFLGTVEGTKEVSITLNPGEKKQILIVYKGTNKCFNNNRHMTENLSFAKNASKNVTQRRELHNC